MAAPTITNISPLSGPVGTVLTVTGTNLSRVCNVVFYGSWGQGPFASTVVDPNPTHGGDPLGGLVIVSATQMRVTIPTQAVSGKIQATGGDGTSQLSAQTVSVT